jgi:hypothetical protein
MRPTVLAMLAPAFELGPACLRGRRTEWRVRASPCRLHLRRRSLAATVGTGVVTAVGFTRHTGTRIAALQGTARSGG